MKKTLSTSLFSFIFSIIPISAGYSVEFSGDLLSKPHRIFEIGFDSSANFANNTLGLNDVLTKNIEIDLQKMASDMPKSGFDIGLNDYEKAFVNLNISSRFRFSFFTELESSVNLNVSKDLFDILGSGIELDETKSVDVTACADLFYTMGASFQTIIKGYGIRFTPTYFVPLMYVPKTSANTSLTMTSEGKIEAKASANVDVYTAVNMKDYKENDKSVSDEDIGAILSNGGFDFSFEIERNWLHGLNAGLYTRIPLVAGTLNYKMSTIAYASFYEDNLLEYVTDKEKEKPKPNHGHVKPSTYGTENEEEGFEYSEDSYKAYRPLKFGLNATYMPWGRWFKIQPSLGFAVRNPYTSDAIFYMEYALDCRLSAVKEIFNVNFGTAYQNQIFQHRFGVGLNFRAIEILAQVSMCGTSFLSTFHTRGYGVFAGARIGL